MNVILFLLTLFAIYSIWARTVGKGLRSLSCHRRFSKPAVFAGEEGELVEVVRNDRPYIIPWLRLESRVSPNLRLGSQENLHVSGEMYYCSLFTLMPYQQIRRTHKVKFLHRGAYDLGSASLTAGDMLGMHRFQRTQELSAPVLVFPRLLEDGEIPAPISQLMVDISKRRQLLQDPFLVRGIRPYQPGDPVRDIHWAATARTGEVQVRLHDYTVRNRVLVVLNGQYDDLQWKDVIPEGEKQLLEHGISLAATFCVRTLGAGMAAGFASNMAMGADNAPVLMLPEEGSAREEELLSAMARLRLHRAEAFPTFLDRLNECADMDILVISLYDSESVRQRLSGLRQQGNQVTFHLLEGGSL